MGAFLYFATLPVRWAIGRAWNLARGFDPDAEYEQILEDLRADLLRRSEGT